MPFVDLSGMDEREVMPGFHGKFVHSENMTTSFWRIEAGAKLPEHAHPHEQVSALTSGRFEMMLEGETRQLEPGTVVVIPSNATHSGTALTDCTIMDMFYPVREDYR